VGWVTIKSLSSSIWLHDLHCSTFRRLIFCIVKYVLLILKTADLHFCLFVLGQKSQSPSTANLPLSNSVKKSSRCLLYPHPQSKRKAAQSLSRAASAISEIEYIDMTEHNEPFLDNTADQHNLDSLEKELNVLKNLVGNAIFFHCR
jgi:hypothetical protein